MIRSSIYWVTKVPAVNMDTMLSHSMTAKLADLLVKGITGVIRLVYAADPVVSDPEVGVLVDLSNHSALASSLVLTKALFPHVLPTPTSHLL